MEWALGAGEERGGRNGRKERFFDALIRQRKLRR